MANLVPMVHREKSYAGLTLLWMRTLLGKQEPRYSSCRAMIDANRNKLHADPQVGEVVLYEHGAHGDIGLYVGQGRVLRLQPSGIPILTTIGNTIGAMPWPD